DQGDGCAGIRRDVAFDRHRCAEWRSVVAVESACFDMEVAINGGSACECDPARIIRSEVAVILNCDSLRACAGVLDGAACTKNHPAIAGRKPGAAAELQSAAVLHRQRCDASAAERKAAVVEHPTR